MLFQIIYFEINGQKSVFMVKKEILKVSMDYIEGWRKFDNQVLIFVHLCVKWMQNVEEIRVA